MRIRALTLAAAAIVVVTAATAVAQTSVGPRPIAPTQGKAFSAGMPFTFRVRDARPGSVFITVSTSKARRKDGTLKKQDWFRKMARKGTVHTKRTDTYPALDDHFLNRRGTYYWQAHRIDCAAQRDCNVEGPVRTFRIR